MIQIINQQITADGTTHPLTTYFTNITQCAQIRIEPVRGSAANQGFVVGPNGTTMHSILAPVAGKPLDSWASTADIPEGNMVWLPSISFKGTSGDQFNVSLAVR
jgi:hypothetical protein